MPAFDTDVFVSGGGPAGLAAAIALRSAGFRVVLADARHYPIDKACGEGLMPEALDAAAQIGVRLPGSLGVEFRGLRLVESGHSVIADFPKGVGLGVRRTSLHSELVRHAQAAGAEMWWTSAVTGIDGQTVRLGKRSISAGWIIGADGAQSSIRRWAGLNVFRRESYRFGFRRHYRSAFQLGNVEIHWADDCQLYLTQVAPDEICVALLTRDSQAKLENVLPQFPELRSRLADSEPVTISRGSIAATRRLNQVSNHHIALVGDAAGAVDPIAGEGLSMAFQQAAALKDALLRGDLTVYERAHRRMMRRPTAMADLMLLLDRWPALRGQVLRIFTAHPRLFSDFVAMHVGQMGLPRAASRAVALAWHLVAT